MRRAGRRSASQPSHGESASTCLELCHPFGWRSFLAKAERVARPTPRVLLLTSAGARLAEAEVAAVRPPEMADRQTPGVKPAYSALRFQRGLHSNARTAVLLPLHDRRPRSEPTSKPRTLVRIRTAASLVRWCCSLEPQLDEDFQEPAAGRECHNRDGCDRLLWRNSLRYWGPWPCTPECCW